MWTPPELRGTLRRAGAPMSLALTHGGPSRMRQPAGSSATPWIGNGNDLNGGSREALLGWGLQRSQLPERLPQLPGVVLAARYVAAVNAPGAGGDWFDAIPLGEGRLGLA